MLVFGTWTEMGSIAAIHYAGSSKRAGGLVVDLDNRGNWQGTEPRLVDVSDGEKGDK